MLGSIVAQEEFVNEYGERFIIMFDGENYYFSGSETDYEVKLLFKVKIDSIGEKE